MAKLTAPCLSLTATGQIAKSIVFSAWKGLKYARQYVVPANPSTAGQQTQRGYLTAAIALWHDVTHGINALDKVNLNRAAGYMGIVLSGFNFYVRNYVKSRVAGATPLQLYNTVENDIREGQVQIIANSVESTVNVKIKWGYSPTAMLYLVTRTEAAVAGTNHTFDLTVPTEGQVIYYQIYDLTSDSLVNLGTGRITVDAAP